MWADIYAREIPKSLIAPEYKTRIFFFISDNEHGDQVNADASFHGQIITGNAHASGPPGVNESNPASLSVAHLTVGITTDLLPRGAAVCPACNLLIADGHQRRAGGERRVSLFFLRLTLLMHGQIEAMNH